MAISIEFLHTELQQLRESIRGDLREELSNAFAGSQLCSQKAPPARGKEFHAPSTEPVLLPGSLPCEQDDVLRFSASQKDRAASTYENVASRRVDGLGPQTSASFKPGPHAVMEKGSEEDLFQLERSDRQKDADNTLLRSKSAPVKDGNTSAYSSRMSRLDQSLLASTTRDMKDLECRLPSIRSSVELSGFAKTGMSNWRKTFSPGFGSADSVTRKSVPGEGGATTRKREKALLVSIEEVFELIAAFAIVANGICMGAQTDAMALKRTEDAPRVFFYLEFVFCAIFTFELLLRMLGQGKSFCSSSHRYWNSFDLFLVCMQIIDLIMEAIFNLSSNGSLQLSFLRMLRILRVLRVMRLLRLLKFFGELNVVSSAIAKSVKSLYGTVLMLFLIIYMFAIAFTGAANSRLVQMRNDGLDIDGTALEIWWSSLGRTVLSLYEAILGGVDWDDLVQGLLEMNIMYVFLFLFYISFMVLTMLNVITGIFVDSAVKHAQQFHEKAFTDNMRRVFKLGDEKNKGTVTKEEFLSHWTRPEFHKYMQGVGIEPLEVRLLFDILDDGEKEIMVDEFVRGMLRLRAGAKFIDIMNLQHVIEQQRQYWKEHLQDFSEELKAVSDITHEFTKSLSVGRAASLR